MTKSPRARTTLAAVVLAVGCTLGAAGAANAYPWMARSDGAVQSVEMGPVGHGFFAQVWGFLSSVWAGAGALIDNNG